VALLLLVISIPMMPKSSALIIDLVPVTTIFPSTNKITGNIGDTRIVDVNVSSVTDMFSGQVFLAYDKAVVKLSGLVEGEFLKRGGANTQFLPTNDTVNGIAGGGVTRLGGGGETGSGQLMRLTFQFIANGFSNLHPRDVECYDGGFMVIKLKIVDVFTSNYLGGNYDIKIVGNAITQNPAYLYKNGYTEFGVEPINIGIYRGQLRFNITGNVVEGDSFAFANVTVPMSLMWSPNLADWAVLLDEVVQGGRYVYANATHTTVSFQFTYSGADPVKMVKIRSTNIVPEFTTVFFAILLVLATLAAAIFGKMTWSVKRKS